MKKVIQISVMLLSVLATVNGQVQTISLDMPTVVPVTPTAAAMEKYHSYPVDHSTGVPSITIPLYEIVAGELTIPVTLTYHSSGLKPKEGSSMVGVGWTLNLEPSVSRSVKGCPDEDTYGWFNNPYANEPPTGDNEKMIRFFTDFVEGIRDTQPDKFTYTLPNGGGAGYFATKQVFLTIPRNNDKVEHYGANMTITDANGIQYQFSGTHEKAGDIITRWMCSSIKSARNPNVSLINFYYYTSIDTNRPSSFFNLDNKVIINTSQRGYSSKNVLTEQVTNTNRHYRISRSSEMGSGIKDAVLTPTNEYEAGVRYPILSRYNSDRITNAMLLEAKFFGNTLTVHHKSAGSDPYNTTVIDSIEVTDKDGKQVRNIKFHTTTYNYGTSLTKLDSVVISAPGVEPKKYSFHYHNSNTVPSPYTLAVDHWGFCNGAESRQEPTIPSFSRVMTFPDPSGSGNSWTARVNYSGTNREPDHEWTKVGVLTQITNPQGIVTRFDFEGNFGAFRDNNNYYNKNYLHPVGGLRVKKIEVVDPKTNQRIITNYQYGLTKHDLVNYEPVWGGGAIKHIVTERDYRSSETHRHYDEISKIIWSDYLSTYSSLPESNITFRGGTPVMYNIVNEEVQNSIDSNKKSTIYRYNVKSHEFEGILRWEGSGSESVRRFLQEQPEEILQQIARRFPAHPQEPSDDYMNYGGESNHWYGGLIRREDYSNRNLSSIQNNEYKRLNVWNGYTNIDLPRRHIKGYTDDLEFAQVFTRGIYYYDPNRPRTRYLLDCSTYRALDKEVITNYYDDGVRRDSLTVEKRYAYKDHNVNPSVSLAPRRIETVNSNNTILIDSLDYLEGYPAILSRHKRIENEGWTESRILFKNNSCLPERVQSRTDQMPAFRDEVIYNAYDNLGNVTEIMGKDGMPITILWGYRSRFPVAKIENASNQQVYRGFNSFILWGDYTEPPAIMWSTIDSLRHHLPDARITTYKYNQAQDVVSITDINNITTQFNYDNYSRLTDSYFLDPKDLRKVILQKYIYNLGE